MNLLEVKGCDDPDLNLLLADELSSAIQSKSEFLNNALLILIEHDVPDFDFGRVLALCRKSEIFRLRAPISSADREILYTVIAAARKWSDLCVHEFSVDKISVSENRNLRQHSVWLLLRTLENNDFSRPDAAYHLLSLLRKDLLLRRGTLSAKLELPLRELQILMEAERSAFDFVQNATDVRLLRNSFFENAEQFAQERFDSIHFKDVKQKLRATKLKDRLEYLRIGTEYARRLRHQANQVQRPELLVWLSIYFLRLADYYCRAKDSSAAIAATIRALETYLQVYLVQLRYGTLESSGFYTHAGQSVEGVGRLWEAAVEEGPSLPADLIDDIRCAIKLRNKSALAHGLQRAPLELITKSMLAVRKFIEIAELANISTQAQFDALWKLSYIVDFSKDITAIMYPIQGDLLQNVLEEAEGKN